MKEKYINIAEASRLLTLAKSTLYTYVHYRTIPFAKVGGRIVFEEETLRKWMKKKEKGVVSRK